MQSNATRYDDLYPYLGEPIVLESDLAFCTTQELIDELLRRKTFLGVVIRSDQEYRCGNWGEERIFKVHFNENLSAAQAGRLLDVVANHLNDSADQNNSADRNDWAD